jgi:hypothetical protein
MTPVGAEDGAGGNRGGFVPAVRFGPDGEADAAGAQGVSQREQCVLIVDLAQDQMGMLAVSRDVARAGQFNDGVRGLHRDLRRGQVRSDHHVQVGDSGTVHIGTSFQMDERGTHVQTHCGPAGQPLND